MDPRIFDAKNLEELAEILGPEPCGVLAVGSGCFYNGPEVAPQSNDLIFHWQHTGIPPFEEDDPFWCFLNEVEMGVIYKSDDGLFWVISIENGDDRWRNVRPVRIGNNKHHSLHRAMKKFERIVLNNLEELGWSWEE